MITKLMGFFPIMLLSKLEVCIFVAIFQSSLTVSINNKSIPDGILG